MTGLSIKTDHVTDLSPVRALTRLRRLDATGSRREKGSLVDLSPLKGMQLSKLRLSGNNVSDLTPLNGMALNELDLWQWVGSDLTPLKGMPLKILNIGGRKTRFDLAQLAGLPLEFLCVNFAQVSDLAPLKGLAPNDPNVRKHERGRPHTLARPAPEDPEPPWFAGVGPHANRRDADPRNDDRQDVGDRPLAPQGTAPERTYPAICGRRATREILREIVSLKTVNGKPTSRFWNEAGAPTTVFDVRRIAALPAAEQGRGGAEGADEAQPRLRRESRAHDRERRRRRTEVLDRTGDGHLPRRCPGEPGESRHRQLPPTAVANWRT